MEASISSFISSSSIATTTALCKTRKTTIKGSNSKISPIYRIKNDRLEGDKKLKWRVNVIGGASIVADAGRAEVTWQIVVGAIGMFILQAVVSFLLPKPNHTDKKEPNLIHPSTES